MQLEKELNFYVQNRSIYLEIDVPKFDTKKKIINDNYISNNAPIDEIKDYWIKNKHSYVFNPKSGSSLIRSSIIKNLGIPHYITKKNKLPPKILSEIDANIEQIYKKRFTFENSIKNSRKIFYLVRCPFQRFISTYYYIKKHHNMWNNSHKLDYPNIDELNIFDFIDLMEIKCKKQKLDPFIVHYLSQKKSFYLHAPENSLINCIWDLESISDLIDVWNEIYEFNFPNNLKENVNISDENIYTKHYIELPKLLDEVKRIYKEDFECLNPVFNYEENFKKKLLTLNCTSI